MRAQGLVEARELELVIESATVMVMELAPKWALAWVEALEPGSARVTAQAMAKA